MHLCHDYLSLFQFLERYDGDLSLVVQQANVQFEHVVANPLMRPQKLFTTEAELEAANRVFAESDARDGKRAIERRFKYPSGKEFHVRLEFCRFEPPVESYYSLELRLK